MSSNIPAVVSSRIKDPALYASREREFAATSLPELLRRTRCYQSNMPRTREGIRDYDLRAVVVPELWERLVEGARAPVRRLTTSVLEWDPTRPSIFVRSREQREQHVRCRDEFRERVAEAARLSVAQLRERALFAISAAMRGCPHEPEAFVYDTAFTCVLVPELVRRVLAASSADRSKYADVVGADAFEPGVSW